MGFGVRFRIALAGRALRIHGAGRRSWPCAPELTLEIAPVCVDLQLQRGRPRRCESALRNPPGARKGRLGLQVLLRVRLTLAGRTLRIHALIGSRPRGKSS